jgi:DNA-binding beta-propeller fold protein YncE
MKRLLLGLLTCLFTCTAYAGAPILVPAWQSEAIFEGPESVVFDQNNKLFYVSNMNGQPLEADGNGYISTLSADGTLIKQKWLSGLNAPKGLALVGSMLYVADINELVVIDTKTATITARYQDKTAELLNDVAADSAGNIYVSDMFTDKIHRLSGDTFSVWVSSAKLEKPNGLFVEGDTLIVGSWGVMTDGFATETPGHLKTIDLKTKKISSLGNQTPAGNLDGVEPDGKGNYFVTDWLNGKLLHITPEGDSTTLLVLGQGSADHTVVDNLVIIPMMLDGNITSFKVKQ